jgi:hypothetical protein
MNDANAHWITRTVLDALNPLVIAASAEPTPAGNEKTNTCSVPSGCAAVLPRKRDRGSLSAPS